MLRSINLFKSIHKYLVLGTAFLAVPFTICAQEQVDFFPFKVKDEVYTASELLVNIDHFKYLECIFFEDAISLKFLPVHTYNIDKMKELSKKFSQNLKTEMPGELKQLFETLVTYIKLKNYIDSQQFKIDKELKQILLKSDKQNKCNAFGFSQANQITPWFEDLVKVEMYFKTRFRDNSFVISSTEISNEMAKNSSLTKESAYKKLLNIKRGQAIEVFLISISKQITHEFFW